MLSVKEKQKLVDKYRLHDTDTGSSEVQAAILTDRIKELAGHLKSHPKDNHSRRGLLKMVAKRKALLDHLAHSYEKRYTTIVKKLGLKK